MAGRFATDHFQHHVRLEMRPEPGNPNFRRCKLSRRCIGDRRASVNCKTARFRCRQEKPAGLNVVAPNCRHRFTLSMSMRLGTRSSRHGFSRSWNIEESNTRSSKASANICGSGPHVVAAVVSGQVHTEKAAVVSAQKAIDRSLAIKKVRLEPPERSD